MYNYSRNVFLLLGGLVLLNACKLVDQRTFNPSAGRRPIPYVPPAPPAPPPPAPPIEVAVGTPQDQWQKPLENLVKDALSRKADAMFMIIALVPISVNSDAQHAQDMKDVLEEEKAIADHIVKSGAKQEQVQLSVKANGNVRKGKIQVTIQ